MRITREVVVVTLTGPLALAVQRMAEGDSRTLKATVERCVLAELERRKLADAAAPPAAAGVGWKAAPIQTARAAYLAALDERERQKGEGGRPSPILSPSEEHP